ncbi:MAG: hypothetical protein HY420_00775 [Candidatus Kerfeldbacteria bacterium]|nr:hypothetical protein [Candidatus Kerfeldbacteria bacterium]
MDAVADGLVDHPAREPEPLGTRKWAIFGVMATHRSHHDLRVNRSVHPTGGDDKCSGHGTNLLVPVIA